MTKQNKDLKDETTTTLRLMAELQIPETLPPEFPALQAVIIIGGSSFKQRLLPGCTPERTRQQSMSLSKSDYSLALSVCRTERMVVLILAFSAGCTDHCLVVQFTVV